MVWNIGIWPVLACKDMRVKCRAPSFKYEDRRTLKFYLMLVFLGLQHILQLTPQFYSVLTTQVTSKPNPLTCLSEEEYKYDVTC